MYILRSSIMIIWFVHKTFGSRKMNFLEFSGAAAVLTSYKPIFTIFGSIAISKYYIWLYVRF